MMIVLSVFLVSLLLASPVLCDDVQQYPPGDARYCPTQSTADPDKPLYRMEVLPGIGFDNLRNVDMGQVVSVYNFSRCQISNDGKFLLPDSIFLTPIKQSHTQVFAEYFDSWDDYTSTVANSINIDAKFFSHINAKFSTEHQSVKSHQVNDKSKTMRIQIRHKRYTVRLQPGTPLHPAFRASLYDIAANLQNNNTEYAHYLSELLVREYGTHFITSMDAGAVVSQVDHIKSKYFESSSVTTDSIAASVGVNFFGKVSLTTSFNSSTTNNDTNGYISNRMSTEVFTYGGPPFGADFTLKDWEKGVEDGLVAIDRSGDPLHYLITPSTLPELPVQTVQEVALSVYKAINNYYKINTRPGCTNQKAPNFDFQANVDSPRVCEPPDTNFTFGGVYQTCVNDPTNVEDLCGSGPEPAAQMNPLTGDYSCSPGYTAVRLNSGVVSHVTHKPVPHKVCHHCHWLLTCCHTETVLAPFLSQANYDAFWCVAESEVHEHSGYLFGGVYTSTTSNPITKSMSCPQYFIPLHFGEDIKVCVSNDYELGYASSVPFGGFESCHIGNALAASPNQRSNNALWPHACPKGYAQHMVTIDEGCEINYCVQSGVLTSKTLLPAKLPPFRRRPHLKNATNTLVVLGLYGMVYVKNQDGTWNRTSFPSDSLDGRALIQTLDEQESRVTETTPITDINDSPASRQSGGSLSNGIVALISIVATLVLGGILVATVFCGRSLVKRRTIKKSGSYVNLDINGEGGLGTAASVEDTSNI